MARRKKKVPAKRCPVSLEARALAEELWTDLEIDATMLPVRRSLIEQQADKLVLYADRLDMTAASCGFDLDEANRCGAANNLRRVIAETPGVRVGGL